VFACHKRLDAEPRGVPGRGGRCPWWGPWRIPQSGRSLKRASEGKASWKDIRAFRPRNPRPLLRPNRGRALCFKGLLWFHSGMGAFFFVLRRCIPMYQDLLAEGKTYTGKGNLRTSEPSNWLWPPKVQDNTILRMISWDGICGAPHCVGHRVVQEFSLTTTVCVRRRRQHRLGTAADLETLALALFWQRCCSRKREASLSL